MKFKEKYLAVVGYFSKYVAVTALVTLATIAVIGLGFKLTATSFLPEEDQGIIFANLQLDDTAGINQTNKVLAEVAEKAMKIDGVKYFISVAGYSMLGGGGENVALGIVGLDDWSKRKSKSLSIEALTSKLLETFAGNKDADINFFAPPSIPVRTHPASSVARPLPHSSFRSCAPVYSTVCTRRCMLRQPVAALTS